ncbi:hypothetical protein LEP1GSC127_4238 [Leptospira kirschneri str. 200801925]|uniref:Uncharacterized protein n=1 Tax=Leptospira kirschneri str. 200802841 TaxID=1193047 RepID=A0A828Y2V2_9LEPT|nr:hypothetical protein LEP1GSC044_1112 [Leptospira kirschneri serovar Grippotyphosa str. RM52]EKO53884.1 hypothetical protein LEP1GSC131_4458 [Leptospira kirschneri str. 200802841]EKQ82937.1 hypothetical protein LEP1GSC064_3151 [Leptospira kirschneri serovar Grippotyphosa str. Moskva]EKR09528.1 hypothetical protein LEP1GSC122_1864 [Leptospira kirschneri serovar Valbuzzi str. 200702274]EMK01055.1 hypothetical protein LEP1GSC176_3508 [Leptospira kirschneri str. MMD1493]EMN27170.1 hypothetical p
MIRVGEFPHLFFMEKSGFYKMDLLRLTHIILYFFEVDPKF